MLLVFFWTDCFALAEEAGAPCSTFHLMLHSCAMVFLNEATELLLLLMLSPLPFTPSYFSVLPPSLLPSQAGRPTSP
ncbi:unnamed protein product, partial [Amoebophrya sp. A120]|eukprot:GSA120T00015804001.1